MELNQDTRDQYFNCQEECNTLTEVYILSTAAKSNILVLPQTMHTKQTLDHKKTVSPPHLEIDFLLDSGASQNVLNNDTLSEIQKYPILKPQASTFVLSAANNSRLQSNGTVNLTLHPDLSEKRDLKHLSFSLLFHVSNTNLIS